MYRRLRFVREYASWQKAQGEMVKAKQEQVNGGLNTEYDEGACALSPDGKTLSIVPIARTAGICLSVIRMRGFSP